MSECTGVQGENKWERPKILGKVMVTKVGMQWHKRTD